MAGVSCTGVYVLYQQGGVHNQGKVVRRPEVRKGAVHNLCLSQ